MIIVDRGPTTGTDADDPIAVTWQIQPTYANPSRALPREGSCVMSGLGDKIEGKADELKGDVKEKVGGATDNRDLQADGVGDQAAGEAKQAIGEAKDAYQDVKQGD
jgi:uncharacterized protein YjbJ (UPF0337 family)